jgi:HD domain
MRQSLVAGVLLQGLKQGQVLAIRWGRLRFGLTPAAQGWDWHFVVTTAPNYQKVRVNAQEVLRDAEVGQLPQHWARYTDRPDVLERRLPAGTTSSRDEILAWFDEGLRQLREAKVLDRFIANVLLKQAAGVVSTETLETTRDEHVSMKELLKAADFAAFKHQRQRRKGAEASPYINHPIGVAYLLADVAGVTDLNTLVAAVLHDTIEDTETTADELEEKFGPRVRDIVVELTDDKSLDKAVRKQLQIRHAPRLSQPAKMIKVADKLSNVRDVTEVPPVDWNLDRRIEYLDWTEKVVAGCRGTNEALEKCYDRVLEAGRARLPGGSADVQFMIQRNPSETE